MAMDTFEQKQLSIFDELNARGTAAASKIATGLGSLVIVNALASSSAGVIESRF